MLLLSWLLSSPALACGGFFCSQVPMDQAEERIVFSVDPVANETEVHVQLRYEGPPTLFSWVLPVPAIPNLKLSTDQLFTSIDARTRPTFSYRTEYRGNCGRDTSIFDTYSWSADSSGGGGGGGGGPDVIVVAEQAVGAYATVTLSASDPVALESWLVVNGYTLPGNFVDVVTPYVMNGAYFVAVKLQNGEDTGSIEPLAFTYQGSEPMIPIILTSIAAVDDMPVEVWLLGPSRAVPINYLHVTISDAAIDWERRGANYTDLIRQAADEAGGQAFATDMAGSSDLLAGLLWFAGRFDVPSWLCREGRDSGDSGGAPAPETGLQPCAEDIPGCEGECVLATLEDNPVDFIGTLADWNIPLDNTLLDILQTCFPMPAGLPAGVTPFNFYSFIGSYERYWRGQPFDAVACAAMVDERILAPLQSAQELLDDQPYLTRMTSSMSANEMTVDPYFSFNPDLPDVPRARTATLTIDCTTVASEDEAPRWWTFSDGSVLADVPPAQRDELEAGPVDEIAAERVELMGRSGPPILVTDRSGEIDALLVQRQEDIDRLQSGETGGADTDTPDSDPLDLETDSELPVDTSPGGVVDSDTGEVPPPVETDEETDSESPVDTDTDTSVPAGGETGPAVDTDTGEDTVVVVETDTDPGVETDTDPGVETDPGVDTDPGVETDPGVDTDPDTEPADDTDPDTEPADDTDPADDTNLPDPPGKACGGCSHQAPVGPLAGLLLLLLRRRR